MKNLLLAFTMLFVFTACEKDEVVEAPVNPCTELDAFYAGLIADQLSVTEGYVPFGEEGYDFDEQLVIYLQVASPFIADWQADIAELGCN